MAEIIFGIIKKTSGMTEMPNEIIEVTVDDLIRITRETHNG